MITRCCLVFLISIFFSILVYGQNGNQSLGDGFKKIKKNYAGGIDEDDLEVQESLDVPEKSVNLHSIQQTLIKKHKGVNNE